MKKNKRTKKISKVAEFRRMIKNEKLPVLTLDSKWHDLFVRIGKPRALQDRETRVNDLLKQQGKMINEIKSMKLLKKQLVNSIVANMGEVQSEHQKMKDKKLSKDKALIEDINEKLEISEEKLSRLPYDIAEANRDLMAEGLDYCYDIFLENHEEVMVLNDEIEELRKSLQERLEKKKQMEENNSLMYAYLHGIAGRELMECFDEISDKKS